ncbi:MAG: hypothetical protein JST26_17645 [Bacteroidetes bacterium]|nr:hypothetical protein [Bacteroidota bacterium]
MGTNSSSVSLNLFLQQINGMEVEIFNIKNSYSNRVFDYLKYQAIKPIILYVVFSITIGSWNPFEYNVFIMSVIIGYMLLFFYQTIDRTNQYIETIIYDKTSGKVHLTIDVVNTKTTYACELEDFKPELRAYDLITRTRRVYLLIQIPSLQLKVRQYDYGSWSNSKMKELINQLEMLRG